MEKQHKISEQEMFKLKDRVAEFSQMIASAQNWEEIKRMRDEYIQTQIELHPEDAEFVRIELCRTANFTLSMYAPYTEEEYRNSK